MNVAGHRYEVLKCGEIEMLHRGALRILAEMGMEIQNRALLEAMAEAGYRVDYGSQRVRFPRPNVERFLAESGRVDWDMRKPVVDANAGVYYRGHYLDPDTNEMLPWNEDRLRFYCALARALPEVGSARMLGCALPVPPPLEPLYERYYAWKLGAVSCGFLNTDDNSSYLYAMLECVAEHRKIPVTDMSAGTVYLVPMMKLGMYEARHLESFWKRGIRLGIGNMGEMGATVPVTFAGAAVLWLAERLALSMLRRVLYGDREISLDCTVTMMDMQTAIYPHGRPEMAMMNVIFAQLARHYGATFGAQCGFADAKTPSVEAGAQKALTAIPTLMAGACAHLDSGTLSLDEVCSPVQMVLDNDFAGALRHFAREFTFDEEGMALEIILGCGPGGSYLDRTHTATHCRENAWQPEVWTRTMFNAWHAAGRPSDSDKAREVIRRVKASDYRTIDFLDPALDKELLSVMESARRALKL